MDSFPSFTYSPARLSLKIICPWNIFAREMETIIDLLYLKNNLTVLSVPPFWEPLTVQGENLKSGDNVEKKDHFKVKINFPQILVGNLYAYNFCCPKEQQQKNSHLLMWLHEIQVFQAILLLNLNLLFPVSMLGQ